MKVNYFFPVFEKDNFKVFYQDFLKTKFYKKYEDNCKFFVCCCKNDAINYNFLKNLTSKNKNIKLFLFDKTFNYNDAFENSVEHFDGDIVLLGDTKIARNDLFFEKCFEKFKGGSNIVHVVKKRKGIKSFIFGIFKAFYNFFIKIFTNKKDRLNEVSLGLIDKDVLDVLKVLPRKRCFLKNTKDLLGFETRSVYIDDKTKTYKTNFKTKTPSLFTSLLSSCLFATTLLLTIFLNIFLNVAVWLNIVFVAINFLSAIVFCLFLPKHIFDLRNNSNKKIKFKVKIIN